MSYVVPQSDGRQHHGHAGGAPLARRTGRRLGRRRAGPAWAAPARRGRSSAGHARVRLELTARYGAVLPDVARAVQEEVTSALATMCAVEVDGVDVFVEEIT